MFMQAISVSMSMCACVCVSVILNEILIENYLCVYVIKAVLEVLKRGGPRCMCVCAREIKYGYECM